MESKIRTKSKFYTHSSNTIGTVTTETSSQLYFNDISLNAVEYKINPFGIGATGLQPTVNSSMINKWAAFRPYPQQYENTYGWVYNTSINQIIHYTGNNDSEKRLGDFGGYNHTAQPSKLLHNPSGGIIGQNYTTHNPNEIGSTFSVQFKFEEISPADLFTTNFDNMIMRVHLGTTLGGSVLASANVSNVINNQVVSLNVPKGFTGYGSRTYSVWFGNTFTSEQRWRYGTEILNEFTLLVKTYFDYVFSTSGIPSGKYFNISVNDENNAFGGRPETSITTLNFNSDIVMSFGDSLKIDVSQNGSTWTEYETITPTSIPATYDINWITAFPSTFYTQEDDRYYVRVTYQSIFGK